jgi:hypothetical protein
MTATLAIPAMSPPQRVFSSFARASATKLEAKDFICTNIDIERVVATKCALDITSSTSARCGFADPMLLFTTTRVTAFKEALGP